MTNQPMNTWSTKIHLINYRFGRLDVKTNITSDSILCICIHLMECSLIVLLALFPYLCIHAYLTKPSPYCQLFSFDSITTGHFAVSSISVVAITMPTLPDDQSPVGFFVVFKHSIKPRLLFLFSVR